MDIYTITSNMNTILMSLANTYNIKMLDMENLPKTLNDNTYALAIDCHNSNCLGEDVKTVVKLFMNNNKSVILLNTNKEQMHYLVGMGVNSNDVVIQPYMGNQVIINVIDNNAPAPKTNSQTKTIDTRTGEMVTTDNEEIRLFSATNSAFNSNAVSAKRINDIISTRPSTGIEMQQTFSLASTDAELPPGISKTYYIKLKQNAPVYPNIPQIYDNELVFVVNMLASYQNPPYKYLTITTLGAGCNPASGQPLYKDTLYDRGFWQNKVNIRMEPEEKNVLTQFTNSPQNINSKTDYKIETSINIDVNIAKTPSFKPSYKVTETYQTSILDYSIINKSKSQVAEWDFVLSWTKDDPYNIFTKPFFDQHNVRELPVLAKQNLQPYCTSSWYVSNTFNKSLTIRTFAEVQYYRAVSETGPFSYNLRLDDNTSGPTNNIFMLDFSQVNP